MSDNKRAVVLLSGGLDSSTCLAIAREEGFDCYALSVEYGQRHAAELTSSRRVATALGAIEHRLARVDLGQFGGSALTDAGIAVPIGGVESGAIPVTYVPARNTVMLSLSLAWAEVLGAGDIFIGVNAVDYSGYPDCRPAFIQAFERVSQLATKAGVEGQGLSIRAPLMRWTKAEIIQKGLKLGAPYHLTHSCYDPAPGGVACGRCDSCLLRLKGFADAGASDPVPYVAVAAPTEG